MMICFLCKNLVNDKFIVRKTLQVSLLSLSVRSISTTISAENQLFTVNYLMNSCGFSPESALSASKYVYLKTPEKPDSVLAFFKRHHFTDTQISSLIKRNPSVISINPEKTLLPKFKFLYSIGISSTDLAELVTYNPTMLSRSLKNQFIPAFNFLQNFIGDSEKIVLACKRFWDCNVFDLEAIVVPNVAILKDFGVPDSIILNWFIQRPRIFTLSSNAFREIVEKVKRMGFDPMTMKFLMGVYAFTLSSKLKWKTKLEAYKKWNLSEEEILVAFRKSPRCMLVSEKKIMAVMDYFVNTMGWEASVILNRAFFMNCSLEKRIVPRCSVLQVLLSKGLIKKDFNRNSLLESPEKLFLQKFVTCYEEEAPQLLKVYREKLDLGIRGGMKLS